MSNIYILTWSLFDADKFNSRYLHLKGVKLMEIAAISAV